MQFFTLILQLCQIFFHRNIGWNIPAHSRNFFFYSFEFCILGYGAGKIQFFYRCIQKPFTQRDIKFIHASITFANACRPFVDFLQFFKIRIDTIKRRTAYISKPFVLIDFFNLFLDRRDFGQNFGGAIRIKFGLMFCRPLVKFLCLAIIRIKDCKKSSRA